MWLLIIIKLFILDNSFEFLKKKVYFDFIFKKKFLIIYLKYFIFFNTTKNIYFIQCFNKRIEANDKADKIALNPISC